MSYDNSNLPPGCSHEDIEAACLGRCSQCGRVMDRDIEPCETCGGTGELPCDVVGEEEECPDCEGTGFPEDFICNKCIHDNAIGNDESWKE